MGILMIFGICCIIFQAIKADCGDKADRSYSEEHGYDFYVDSCGKFRNVYNGKLCGNNFFRR